MGIVADRITETIAQHRPQADRPSLCACGFPLATAHAHEEHQARAIASRLYGTRNRDLDHIPDDIHRGHPDNIALHRAMKEPLCAACSHWLESRAG